MPSRTLETILTGRNELSPVLATAARDVVAYEAAVEAANSRSAESASKSAERQRAAADQVVEANSKVKESAEEAARQVSDVRVELTALDGKTADVGVDVDTADARAQLDEVNTRLDEVAASKPTARVEAETTAAEERLRAVQAELDRIDGERVTATARVEAETAAAQAELRALQAELDRIDGERATAKVDVDTAGSYSGVSSLIGALGMVAPAIVPIGAAAIAAGASIGTMAAAGVAGAGIMAIAFGGVVKALKLLDQQESQQQAADYTAAQGASARAQAITSAQRQIASAQMALGDAQRQADEQRITSAEAIQNAVRGQAAAQMALGDTQRQAADAQIQASEQVVAAQYNLQQADQAEANAVKALTDARAAATRQLESYANQAVDAQLAEKQAVLDLQTAQDNQRKTAASGTATAQQRAQADLDLQKAQQRLTEAQQAATNASQDNTKAQKDGVDGAPQVVSAVKAVSDAQHGQRDAAQNLADAQRKQAEQSITSQEAIGKAQQAVAVASQGVADARRKAAQQEIASQESVQRAQQGVAAAMEAMQSATAASAGATSASLAQINDKVAKLDPATRSFAEYLRGTWKPIWEQVQHAAAGGLLPGVQAGMDELLPVMPVLTDIVGAMARAMGGLFTEAGRALGSPFWTNFFTLVKETAGPLLSDLGHILGNVAAGFAGILAAFTPMSLTIGGGLVDLSGKFATWGENLSKSQGFHDFIDYVREQWPTIKGVIENVGTAIGHIIQAGGILGGPTMQLLRIFSGILAGLPVPVLVALVGAFEGFKIFQTITGPFKAFSDTLDGFAKKSTDTAGNMSRIGSAASSLSSSLPLIGLAAAGIGAAFASQQQGLDDFRNALDGLYRKIGEGGTAAQDAQADLAKLKAFAADHDNQFGGSWFGNSYTDQLNAASAAAARTTAEMTPLQRAQQGVSAATDDLSNKIEKYGADSPQAQTASANLAAAQDILAKKQQEVANATHNANIELEGLISTQQTQASANLGLEAGLLNTGNQIDAYKKSLGDATLSANDHKLALNQVEQSMINVTDAAKKKADADNAGKSPAQIAAAEVVAQRDALNQMVQQLGFVPPALQGMYNQLNGPQATALADSKTRTDNLKTAMDNLATATNNLPYQHGITVTADTQAARDAITGLTNDYHNYSINVGLGGTSAYAAADGGVLPGWTPGRDVHMFTSPSGGSLALSGGEAVMRPEFTAAVGSGWVHSMNAAAKSGGSAGVRSAMGFADGGVIPWDPWSLITKVGIDPASLLAAQAALGSGAAYTGQAVGPPGAGVERWRSTVLEALDMMGQSPALANSTLRRMNQESGGNPTIVNRSDINWQRGTPSVGLMQVIGPTYRANRDPRHDVGPYSYGTSVDGLSNVLASMHYAIGRYGSLAAAYNKAGGYAGGGDTPAGGPFWVGERGPELLWSDRAHYVSTAEQSARLAGAGFGPVGYNAAGTGFTAAAAPGYSAVTGGGLPAPTQITVSLAGARITGRLELGTDGLATLVDARIDGAFDELHDTVHYATGG